MTERPLARRRQLHDGLDHRERCGIGRRLGAAHLAEDALHFGKRGEDPILPLELDCRMDPFGIIRRRDSMLAPGAELLLQAIRREAARPSFTPVPANEPEPVPAAAYNLYDIALA